MSTPLVEASPPHYVCVFGAAGFIGRFAVDELRRAGWRVRAFVRPSELNPFASAPEVEVVRGDIRDFEAVRRALAGVSAAVNLAGAKSDERESEAVNVGGARHIVAAAREHGGIRILHISTQAVKIARQGVYARTKLAAELVFQFSELPVTILRPSVVYGPDANGVFAAMRRAIETLPIVPVLGDGRWISAPVHVIDLARAIVACLATPATVGRTYDIGGPDFVTMDEMLDRIAVHAGRRCRKLHIPFGVALPLARAAVTLLPRAPVSVSNVLGANQEIPIDLEPARRDFGFAPRTLEEGLRAMDGGSVEARASRPLRAGCGRDAHAPNGTGEPEAVLAEEGRRFTRYLLGGFGRGAHARQLWEGDGALAVMPARYVTAVAQLFPDGPDGDVMFVRRHPWALPLVDAAAGLLRPGSQLRERLLLASALLETSPAYAELFLAPPPARVPLISGLAARAASSVLKLVGGACLLPFVRSSCRRIST